MVKKIEGVNMILPIQRPGVSSKVFPTSPMNQGIPFPGVLPVISLSSMEKEKNTFQTLRTKLQKWFSHNCKKNPILPLVGGVKNIGNTCAFSAILQHVALLSEYYKTFLSIPFESEKLDKDTTQSIEKTRKCLWECTKKILRGKIVSKKDVATLVIRLQRLGLCKTSFSHFNFDTCYDDIFRSFFIGMLIGKSKNKFHLNYESVFWTSTNIHYIINKLKDFSKEKFLCSVLIDKSFKVRQNFELNNWKFSLKSFYVCKKRLGKKHVVFYREYGNHWLCCDDDYKKKAKTIPSNGICTAFYEIDRSLTS